ncbi:MAG: hypothetical protein ACUVRP_08925 [Chlorobiales bacterium]
MIMHQVKSFILAISVFSASCTATELFAQPINPCNDPEFLRLKSLPKASMTESERKAFNKLNADCEKFKERTAQPIEQTRLEVPKQNEQSDTAKVALKEEPFATARNFTILGAMCAAVVGIIVAINSIAESPF